MNDNQREPTPEAPPAQHSTMRKIGIGVALAMVPAAAIPLVMQVKAAGERKAAEREKQFAYDATGVSRINPADVKFREIGRIETGFALARAIATDGTGRLLIAGQSKVRIVAGDGSGATVEFSTPQTAQCLATDSAGRVYAGIGDHVEVYAADGTKLAGWKSMGERSIVTSIAVSADGKDVWVADAGARRVRRFDAAGTMQLEVGGPEEATHYPGLIAPSPHMDVAIGADGMVWIANPGAHRLEGWSRDGTLVRTWGASGTAQEAFFGCCNPSDFTILPDGHFVTAEKGVARVKLYTAEGQFDCVVATPEAFAPNMLGLDVASDGHGRVLVLEPGTRVVRVFERKG